MEQLAGVNGQASCSSLLPLTSEQHRSVLVHLLGIFDSK